MNEVVALEAFIVPRWPNTDVNLYRAGPNTLKLEGAWIVEVWAPDDWIEP